MSQYDLKFYFKMNIGRSDLYFSALILSYILNILYII